MGEVAREQGLNVEEVHGIYCNSNQKIKLLRWDEAQKAWKEV